MIQISGLEKNFGRLKALDNINLSFSQGECIALIGPNGCGKTTLIKSILGMVVPDKGTITVNGENTTRAYRYRRHIGYMPQIGRYPDNMNIGQIIDMIRNIRNSDNATDEDLYHAFNLAAMSGKKMRTLSGGTTQKVSATLAFLFDPKILILDEPTAGLDPLAADILKEKIIAEKKKGKLILITSHLLSELDELISQIVFMQDGKLMFHKSTQELESITGERKTSKAIAHILRTQVHGQDH